MGTFEERNKIVKFKKLTLCDKHLLLDFLLWLTPEALEFWYHYGKTFNGDVVEKILSDFTTIKIGGIETFGKEKIVVFGHLYHFTEYSCRLGIVAGILGKGYGTKMMIELIETAKQMGCKKVYLSTFQDNNKALSLYRRFGFIILKEFTDRPKNRYEMVLKL